MAMLYNFYNYLLYITPSHFLSGIMIGVPIDKNGLRLHFNFQSDWINS